MTHVEITDFLRSFHSSVASATPIPFSRMRASGPRHHGNSYQVLGARILAHEPERVLDVGCGEGELLDLLRDIPRTDGVDLVDAQIKRAKRRAIENATFHVANAHSLPFEPDSFDVITAHMSLMLMQPLEEVLAELRRVVRPTGTLIFMVGEDNYSHGLGGAYVEELRAVAKTEDIPKLRYTDRALGEGWPRILERSGWRVQIDELIDFNASGPLADILEHFELSYDFYRLSGAGKSALKERCRERFGALASDDGEISFSFRMRLFEVSP